jgi:3-hydroxyisobutyrate dehydrogenase-like beta-hydroxyacid dehydrogenase
MEPKVLFGTIADSGAATVSNLFRELGPKILGDDFSPLFSIDNLHKDMRLGIEMAHKVGADFLVSEANQRLNTLAREAGFGSEDTAAAVKICRRMLEG